MGARVAFQIKGIVESFCTKSTEISLNVAVTLHMSIQQTLQSKRFIADPKTKIYLKTVFCVFKINLAFSKLTSFL